MSDAPVDRRGHALWGGRFEGGLSGEMEALNRSLDVDRRLWREDIRGSRAWAGALGRAGFLATDEVEEIARGLGVVEERLAGWGAGDFAAAPDEDIHSLVERLLTDTIGPLGGKLHTGRSRNDQVATDFRLWGREAIRRQGRLLAGLAEALAARAREHAGAVMPGYTHLQRAQPVPVGHWLLSRAWPLVRDLEHLVAVHRECDVLPLGAGALAGCPFPVDRAALAADLGFARISENSIDTVADRDWCARLVFGAAMTGVHLSQLAEDLVLFSTSEFGFVRLADGFTTGSSLMPQKRNPDVAELVRGKAGRLVGNLAALLTLLKGLPTGYNRDLQEDKETVFDAVDTLELVLPALAGAVHTMTVVRERTRAALDAGMLATDLADYLVRRGVPFRESHHAVGALVRLAEESGRPLDALATKEMQSVDARFEADAREVFDPDRSVASRDMHGGTSARALRRQLRALDSALAALALPV